MYQYVSLLYFDGLTKQATNTDEILNEIINFGY